MQIKRHALVIVCGLGAVIAAGCRDDEIRHYQVPRGEPTTRLLGAIFPQGESTWFLKLVGPVQAVDQQQEPFQRFVHSVHFPEQGQPPIAWTVPEGWKQEPGEGLRYATFVLGSKDAPLELTVHRFEGAAGSVLANVNRWRDQMGLGPLQAGDLDTVTKEAEVHGVHVTLIDMVSFKAPTPGKKPAPMGNRTPRPSLPREPVPAQPLRYTTPPGWEEHQDPQGFAAVAFRVAEGDRSAEVTVTPLGGLAGGLAANVNRWRDQLGLPAVGEDELRKEVRDVRVEGGTAQYVDLTGPAAQGEQRRRILVMILPQGERTWFFKMIGPADVVARQQAAFEAFVKSVRFAGDTGANHE